MKFIILIMLLVSMTTNAKIKKTFHQNSQLESVGNYKNEKREGDWIFYYANGKEHAKGTYSLGAKVGEWNYFFESGEKSVQQNYDKNNPKKHTQVDFFENGNKKVIAQFNDGKRIGKWIWYYENGNTKEQALYKDNLLLGKISHYENGNKKEEGRIKNNLKTGLWKMYTQNGSLSQTINYKENLAVGESDSYDEKGNITYTTVHDDDNTYVKFYTDKPKNKNLPQVKEGKYTWYYDNGTIKEQGDAETEQWKLFYTNGKLKAKGKLHNGKKYADWTTYFQSGEIKSFEKITMGVSLNKITYYKNGNKHTDTNGNLFYYPNGQVIEEKISKSLPKNIEWIINNYAIDGQVLRKTTAFKIDNIYSYETTYFYENGNTKYIEVRDAFSSKIKGSKLLEIKSYFDINGNPLNIGTFKNGNGAFRQYTDEGLFKEETNYIQGYTEFEFNYSPIRKK